MALVPPIGISGLFQLSSPYSNLLQTNVSYRCDAVRRLSDLIDLGVEPYEEYYLPFGLTQAQYDQDVINRVSIITLISDANHVVRVPTTYLISYPDINGVPYHVMLLGIELGAIPNNKDLTGIKQIIANLVRDTIGVVPTIREAVASAEQKVSQQDHEVLEAARASMITNTQTDRAKLLAAEKELAALRIQYNALETYVKNLAS